MTDTGSPFGTTIIVEEYGLLNSRTLVDRLLSLLWIPRVETGFLFFQLGYGWNEIGKQEELMLTFGGQVLDSF